MIEIACVLLNYKNPEDTIACLRSFVEGGGFQGFKFFLINNYPGDGSGPSLQAFLEKQSMPYEYIEPGTNTGYTGGVNMGVRRAMAENIGHVMLLNNDCVVAEGFAAEALRGIRAYPREVLAGWVLDFTTGEPSFNTGRITPWVCHVKRILDSKDQEPFDFVSGCLAIIPTEVYRKVGLLEEAYFMYREDLDFCLRLREAGIRIRYLPDMVVRHKVSSSADRTGTPKEYYRIRNQTHIILRRARLHQKVLYLLFLSALLIYKLRDFRIFLQFTRGTRDAITGRLGALVPIQGTNEPGKGSPRPPAQSRIR